MRLVRSQFVVGEALIALTAVALLVAVLAPTAGAAEKALVGQFGTATGEGAGKVTSGRGIAVNRGGAGGVAAGSVFVADSGNARVDQFSAAGVFVRAFGWDVAASGSGDVGANETQTVSVRATSGSYTLTVATATAIASTTSGSATLTKVSGGLGQFRVGDAITGTGIPANTTVTCVSPSPGCTTPETLTLSQAATSTSTVANTVFTGRETTASIDSTAPPSGAGSVEAALNALPGVGPGGVTVTGGPGDATGSTPYSVTFSGGPLAHDDLAQMTGASALVNPLTGGSPTTGVTVATTAAGGGREVCNAAGDQCKAGVALATAGSVNGAEGIAVDQDTGNVLVASTANRRIDVFSATGTFQGAFGRGVVSGGTGLEFCTTTCLAGVAAATAGAFGTNGLTQAAITVAPDGAVYVGDRVNRRINEFALTHNGSDEVTGVSFTRAFGWGVRDGAAELQTCTTATGCLAGTAGGGDGQFPNNTPSDIAIDDDGLIYTVGSNGTCSPTNPCRVQVFNPDGTFKQNFGPAEGGADTCQLTWTSGHWGGQAPNGIAIDPDTQHVYISRKDFSEGTLNGSPGTFEVCEFDSDGSRLFRSPATSLPTNNNGYLRLAVGSEGAVYVSAPVDTAIRGAISILGEIPPPGADILPVTAIGQTTAQLNGRVTVPEPGGDGFEPSYRFEYSADNGLNWAKAPIPDAALGTDSPGPVNVSQQLFGLEPNLTYRVRLVATIGQSTVSGETTFKTLAAKPTVKNQYVLPIGDLTATLRGTVNPNNSPTNYQFEYGTTTSYGSQAPAFEPFIGDGGQDQKVSIAITGLTPNTTYNYRLVATNTTGTTYGPNRTFATHRCPDPNSQGLAACRAYELVSPTDGQLGTAGELQTISPAPDTLLSQVAPTGSRVAYAVTYGLPDSTSGGDVNYVSTRTDTSGWRAEQVTPSVVSSVLTDGYSSYPGLVHYLSEDLGCSLVVSGQPLTSDVSQGFLEDGGVNLFRRDADGEYTLINPTPMGGAHEGAVNSFKILGASDDCRRVVFKTGYRFAGVESTGGLYESDHGVLREVGIVPGPTGPVSSSSAEVGIGNTNYLNAVSRGDTNRIFFSATRATSPLAGEVGKLGLFVRKDGVETVDVSLSETSTPNAGARYQDAAVDGSKVLFTANYGLTGPVPDGISTTSNCGANGTLCDLYEYDVETGDLTNLTATTDPANTAGAVVEGVLDASDDGEWVYFAAQGQLVAGQGNSYAQNTAGDGAYNIYLAHAGTLSFVAVVSKPSLFEEFVGTLTSPRSGNLGIAIRDWGSRATPNGRHLLFQAQGDVAGHDGDEVIEAYLYAADSGTTVCVSCRRDGQPSTANQYDGVTIESPPPLNGRDGIQPTHYHFPSKAISDDGRHVFFLKTDALASGAEEGDDNLYEWYDGQVALLASEPNFDFPHKAIKFLGVSGNGQDAYFATDRALVPTDTDSRANVYAARVDGGFAPPDGEEAPCDPLVQGSCQVGGLVVTPPLLATGLPTGGGQAQPGARHTLGIATVSRRARTRAARTGVLAVRVTSSGPGRVGVVARAKVGGKVRVVARGAGTATVKMRLNAVARRVLRSGKSVRLTVEASQAGARNRTISILLPGVKS